ncbi:MAG: RNA-binding S4 domain-containing protein [Halofilum sp. (in: g-proteobacteria)]|nr:RNA-binding S4 domain-containing protein [Halofilum sp. (in: g-proteobacteria)]
MADANDSQRLDSWLWVARFFKTRSLARKAVTGGHVTVNGANAKPARAVGAGDRLAITTPGGRFVVDVLALAAQRGPAAEARELYRETVASREAREKAAEEHRQRRSGVVFDRERPDRRQRRAWIRLRRRGE